jgi:CubicO group peptidase (beta-lactamase class C family)
MSGLHTTRRTALAGGLAAGGLFGLGAPALAAPPGGFDALVGEVMAAFGTPGLSVAIVDGGAVMAKGYGVRRLGAPERVDDATLFNIASNTKAFTAAALAILVDEGRIGWDDPVIDHLPRFRMWDAYVTREMTVRDLLVHRSGLGLGAGDLLFWPGTTFTRAEIVERLRHIRPARSFRAGYAYDNVLYIAAGELVGAVAGKPWEAFVAERLLVPLGMAGAVPTDSWLKDAANRSAPHARLGGAVRGLGAMTPLPRELSSDNHAPAGGIICGARDIAAWLKVQLAHGALPGGRRLWSEEQTRQMWRGQTIIRATGLPGDGPDDPSFVTYALGWNVQQYRGHTYIWHSGGIAGQTSITALIPAKNVGFAILTNAEEGMVVRTLMNSLLDHYLALPRVDWLADGRRRDTDMQAEMAKAAAGQAARPADAGPPSLPLAGYAGTYRDAWYGDVTVTQAGGGLRIDFVHSPALKGALEPWSHDTFRTRFDDRSQEDAFLSFALNPDGTIDQVKLQAVSPMADFSYDYQDLLLKPVKPAS